MPIRLYPDDTGMNVTQKDNTSGVLLHVKKRCCQNVRTFFHASVCTSQSKYTTLIIVMRETLLSSMEGECQIQSGCLVGNREEGAESWNKIEEDEDRLPRENHDKVPGEGA